MSIGGGSKKTSSSFKNQSDPWDETIPYLQGFLADLGGAANASTPGANADQTAAFSMLKANAQQGNPFTGDIMALAGDQFATADNTGTVRDGYADLQRRLGDTANGKNLNMAGDPYLQGMLTQVGDEVQNRINAQFAAAGRDFSGANQGAVAKGVTSAQLPLLMDWFNNQQGRTDAAARDLFSASGSTASQIAQLDQARNAVRSAGIDTATAATTARDQGANTILQLSQQMKDLPYNDLAQIANLLFPAAGLGQQSSGTQNSTTKSSQWGIGIGDIGKMATALGTLCDVRLKTDIAEVGALADGTPIYAFRYLGSPKVHIGPMAQEVAARIPEAVAELGPDKIMIVDLERATARSAEIMRQRKEA